MLRRLLDALRVERWSLLALVFALANAETDEARAETSDRMEARQRFDRGLEAYDAGDFEGALAEFERAHELTGHPIVLYNIGLVEAGLGNAVESVRALEQVLASPDHGLGEERLALAQKTLREQQGRLGSLRVVTDQAVVRVQIDGVDVTTPLGEPIPVRSGVHLVSLFAPGYAPLHQRVTVASAQEQTVQAQLDPLEEEVAELVLVSNVDDATLTVNGVSMGQTPFSSAIALRPGQYRVRLERPGYFPVERDLRLHAGSTAKLDLPLRAAAPAPGTMGTLLLEISERNAVVLIDDEPHAVIQGGLRLPLGRHRLVVRRGGFYDVRRDVVVTDSTAVTIELLPQPAYLQEYVSTAEAFRTSAYLTGGAGVLAAGFGAGFLVWNQGNKDEAKEAFDEQIAVAESTSSGDCQSDTCQQLVDLRLRKLTEARERDVWGWVGIGTGVGLLAGGVVLYALGDDPDRYELRDESDVFSRIDVKLQANGMTLSGRF